MANEGQFGQLRPDFTIKTKLKGGGAGEWRCSSVVEYLSNMSEVLDSVSIITINL